MYMYMRDPKEEVVLNGSPLVGVALAVTSTMVLVLGVFPSILLNLVRVSVLG
jgi:NADH:ubiquinone oxidoreductase subunit 2 (subunit N)